MPYDEALAKRVGDLAHKTKGVVEKKMFGGIAFLVKGNMSIGVHGTDLIVRIDPAETEAALTEPGVRIFDITGRPMKGWLLVAKTSLADGRALGKWVRRGVTYAASLPQK